MNLFKEGSDEDTSEDSEGVGDVATDKRGGYQSALRELGHRVYRGPTGPSDIQRGLLDNIYSQVDAIQERYAKERGLAYEARTDRATDVLEDADLSTGWRRRGRRNVAAVVPGLKASSYFTKSELLEDEISDDTSEDSEGVGDVAGRRRGGYQSALREVGHRVYRGPTGPSDIQRGLLDNIYSQIDAIQERYAKERGLAYEARTDRATDVLEDADLSSGLKNRSPP